jgi:hypothetical protein
LARNYVEDCAKTDQERSIVNGNARIWDGREIFGEEAIGDTGGDEKEQALPKEGPEREGQSKKDKTFWFGERIHGLAAVEDPYGSEI